MEVNVKYLQADPKTGVLRYRRAFPSKLRPFIRSDGSPLTEYKVSLGVRSLNDAGAMALHDEAAATYEQMVARATLLANGSTDRLDAPLIEYLASHYIHQQLALDEASRWGLPLPSVSFEPRCDLEADYEANRALLEGYDTEGLVAYWRDWTVSYAQGMGYVFDTTTPAFKVLCRALGEAACKLWLAISRRLDNLVSRTPEPPVTPVVTVQTPLATAVVLDL